VSRHGPRAKPWGSVQHHHVGASLMRCAGERHAAPARHARVPSNFRGAFGHDLPRAEKVVDGVPGARRAREVDHVMEANPRVSPGSLADVGRTWWGEVSSSRKNRPAATAPQRESCRAGTSSKASPVRANRVGLSERQIHLRTARREPRGDHEIRVHARVRGPVLFNAWTWLESKCVVVPLTRARGRPWTANRLQAFSRRRLTFGTAAA